MKRKFILLAMMLLTLIGGVKFNVLNAQEQYRVKFPTLGDYYLTIFNNTSHPDGPVGGVGVDVYQESNAQKFTIETGANGGVYLKSADGYYIYCNGGSGGWNVDAINGSDKSELYGFDMTGGSFKIYDDNGYIKVQEVNSAYYIFHDASYAQGASWQLEEVLVDDGIIPAAPTNLVATAIDHKSISLTWTAGDENALRYNMYQGGVNIGSTTETSYTVEGLTAETNYCFTVEAVRGVNVSASHSDEACATTLEAPATRDIVFLLQDSYGDGWNGGYLNVSVNEGTPQKLEFPCSGWSGCITKEYTLSIEVGAKVNVTYSGGSYPSECTYSISYFEGDVIRANAALDVFEFTVVAITPSVTVTPNSIAFGSVKVGDEYWSEKPEPSFDVNVTAKNTTIASISCDNDFFTFTPALSGAAEQTEFNFTVSYDKEAEAGEKSGTITVKYMDGEEEKSETISLSATAYVPAQGDVVEKAKTVAFTDGSYTDNATDMYDDYILPGEENDGSNGDAVYAFSLTEDAVITADVEGTNGIVAIYKKEVADAEGIKADNNDTGVTLDIVQTADSEFTFDFEDIVLEDHFTLVEYDGNDNHWQIINDYTTNSNTIISYSYTYGGINTADNYIITKEVYNITATSTLTMDAKCGGQDGVWDEVMVKVSTNGEEFTLIQTVKPESKQWVNGMTIDLGAKFAELGLSYGNYHIALHHKNNYIYSIQVDNLKLSDGSAKSRSMARSEEPQINAVQYSAGDYYLVAAAEGEFTLNLSTGTIPAPEAVTYTFANNATEQDNPKLTWTYGEYATEYQVLLGTSENLTEDDVVVDWTSPLATSYQTKDLQNNTKYYWQVNVKNATGTTTGEIYNFITPLDVPQNVTASATELYTDENSTTITWDVIEGITYNVYVDGVKHNSEPLADATYTLTNLACNVSGYSITITAIHELGESQHSEPVVVKVGGTFTLTVNVTDGTNPIEGATVIVEGDDWTFDQLGFNVPKYETITDASGNAIFENVRILRPSTQAYSCYYITASYGLYNEGNETLTNYTTISDGGNVTKTITMTLPSPLSVITSEDHYFVGEDVTLSWEAPTLNTRAFLGYNVYQINYGEDETKLNEELLTETSYTITGLEYGSYSFGVTAVYDEGESSHPTTYVKVTGYGEISGTVKDDNNEPIKGVSITVEGYNEFYEEVTYTATSDASGAFSIENVMLSSYEGYTLTATKFDYQEKVVTGIEVGYNTTTQCDVTMQTLPGGTFAVTASEVGENVEVTWDVPTGGVAYNVYRRFDGDVTPLTTEEITTQSFTDETWSTLADGEYEYGVSAKIAQGLNITEDFEDGIPSTWAVYNARNNATSVYNWTTANIHDGISSYEGTYAAYAKSSTYGDASKDYYYLVTDLIDLTGVVNPKLTFQYHTPGYNGGNTYCNTLKVKILTEEGGQNSASPQVSHNWTNEKTNTNYWTPGLVDLSGYVGQKIYIAFENYPYYGDCSSIDYVQITSEATTYTTGVSWADPITKGGIEFLATADGNWNVGSNWSTGEVPSATDKVTIKGNAVITENVNINTITIADGASLTLESGVLTAEIINNKNAEAFVIEDGAQLFQNNNNVAATFNMGITTPQQWSNANQDGWQFIASPFTNAEMSSFIPSEGEYDLYKYDGTKDLEWVNHKAAQGGDEFTYNFESGIPAEITQINADDQALTSWNVPIDGQYTYIHYLNQIPACVYSEVYANADNYLVLPKSKVIEGSYLKFKATSYWSKAYAQQYITNGTSTSIEILISENTNTSTSDFESVETIELENGVSIYVSLPNAWQEFTVDLSAYADKEVYIALRHNHNSDNTYGQALLVDDVQLISGSFVPFDETLSNGKAYLASYETETVASLEGALNNASSHTWNLSYSAEKDLANFHLLGNPFPFDMDVTAATYNNLVEGVAIVNNQGGYTYDVTTIPVGDGFFVKATGENPTLSYDAEAKATRGVKANSLNVIATSNAGKDNVVINLGGEKAGFNKLQNFNDAIATVYVQDNGANYGIYNCNADVQEIELNFNANQMGNYTISIEPNGKFQTVTLVDRFTGIETNMLVEDYHFTAMSNVNTNRFIVRMVNGQESTDNSHFVYQSGEDLIIDAEGTVQIIDVMGRVLVSDEVESTNNRINVSGFQNGTYMVRVINGSEVKVEKVVIY